MARLTCHRSIHHLLSTHCLLRYKLCHRAVIRFPPKNSRKVLLPGYQDPRISGGNIDVSSMTHFGALSVADVVKYRSPRAKVPSWTSLASGVLDNTTIELDLGFSPARRRSALHELASCWILGTLENVLWYVVRDSRQGDSLLNLMAAIHPETMIVTLQH